MKIKSFEEWVSEGDSHFAAPTSLEMTIGNIITPLDYSSEGWIKEIPRLPEYKSFSKEIQKALNTDNDIDLSKLIERAKEMNLFRNEQDTTWKRLQSAGAENPANNEEFRKKVGRYIINKIQQFSAWTKSK